MQDTNDYVITYTRLRFLLYNDIVLDQFHIKNITLMVDSITK